MMPPLAEAQVHLDALERHILALRDAGVDYREVREALNTLDRVHIQLLRWEERRERVPP